MTPRLADKMGDRTPLKPAHRSIAATRCRVSGVAGASPKTENRAKIPQYRIQLNTSPMPAPEGNDFAAGNDGGAPPGNTNAVGNDGGAPESNTNARKHGLYMREEDYIERQSAEDQRWIHELTESMVDMWRERHKGKPPKTVRSRLENIAIDCHKVSQANDYFAAEGLTQMRQEVVGEEKITSEKLNLWASEIRHYNDSIEKRMDKHGLLDPPEDRDGVSEEYPDGTKVYESSDYKIIEHPPDADADALELEDDGEDDES